MCELNTLTQHNFPNLEMETDEQLLNSNIWRAKKKKDAVKTLE